MVRVAIAEDDKNEMQVLRSYVERCSKERGFLCTVDCFTDGDAIAENVRGGYDIIFLDIEMPLMNGMDAAEQIREADKDVTIIFTTHNPNYAILGTKMLQCMEEGIDFHVMAEEEALSFMNKMDISALFGNILDNAIEGTRKVDDPGNRHIRLYVSTQKGFLKILAENTYSGNVSFEEGIPATSKR